MMPRPVYLVDGARTPFLKAKGVGDFTAGDLAVSAGKALLMRQPFNPNDLDEVILGCVMASAEEANIARVIALRLGCGDLTPAFTVQRNCASGLQAIDCAFQDIAYGRYNLVLAGGTESMSRAPLYFRLEAVRWLSAWTAARSFSEKAKVLLKFRPYFLAPVVALLQGLTDPIVNMNMGQTAEQLAYRYGISREEMDVFSQRSHNLLGQAQDQRLLGEIIPIFDAKGNCMQEDTGLRRNTSLEKLAELKPYFDKYYGSVTAGNSSQVTDGAVMMILASEDAVKKYNLPILAKISDIHWAALDPREMGLGPVHATMPLLARNQLTKDDIDFWEINEAFAAQVLACLKAFNDNEYCKQHFNLPALGEINLDMLNIHGGAIAAGHPVGASGARIVLHLAQILKQKQAKRGVASICIGGGQGGAVLIEAV